MTVLHDVSCTSVWQLSDVEHGRMIGIKRRSSLIFHQELN